MAKKTKKASMTPLQKLGEKGERLVVWNCMCPSCKREKTLKRLRANFKCADIICDFCGFLAQVKTSSVASIDILPKKLLGGAWGPQRQRIEAGVYTSLFIVLIDKKNARKKSIYFLPSELQRPEMFVIRKPLSNSARRAGWQGFYYDLRVISDGAIVCLKRN